LPLYAEFVIKAEVFSEFIRTGLMQVPYIAVATKLKPDFLLRAALCAALNKKSAAILMAIAINGGFESEQAWKSPGLCVSGFS
jgi:hypothetical protein